MQAPPSPRAAMMQPNPGMAPPQPAMSAEEGEALLARREREIAAMTAIARSTAQSLQRM